MGQVSQELADFDEIDAIASRLRNSFISQKKELDRLLDDNKELREETLKENARLYDEREDLNKLREENKQLLEDNRRLKENVRDLKAHVSRLEAQPSSRLSGGSATAGCVTWQFESFSGDWSGMPTDASATIQANYEQLHVGTGATAEFEVKSGVDTYLINLDTMKQTNLRTRKKRNIRCKFNTPCHWTSCVDMASIYPRVTESGFKLAGFVVLDCSMGPLAFIKSREHYNGRPVWWSTCGHFQIYWDTYWKTWKLNLWRVRLLEPKPFFDLAYTNVDDCPFGGRWKVLSSNINYAPQEILGSMTKLCRKPSAPHVLIPVDDSIFLESVRALMKGTIVHAQRHWGPSSCNDMKDLRILRVLRVESWSLWTAYLNCARAVRSRLQERQEWSLPMTPAVPNALRTFSANCGGLDAGSNEELLFHGTSMDVALRIAVEGFDFRMSKEGYYGTGTYFASQACKSDQYSCKTDGVGTIILARVAVGDIWYAQKVDRLCRRPPMREEANRPYDSVVANPGPMPGHSQGTQAHQEIVTFNTSQAYPEFIVNYVLD